MTRDTDRGVEAAEAPGRPAASSAAPRPRLAGLDVARGLAIAGMALVNFDLALPDGGGPAWLGTIASSVQGRASALFVLLAGVGIGLLARSRPHPGRVVARRGFVLLALGFAFLPLWPADILHFYGLWFVLAAPLLRLSALALGALALGLVLLFPALLAAGVDYERHWNFTTLEYAGQWSVDGLWRHLFVNGFHPTVPWLAFLLAGLALGPRLLAPDAPLLRIAAGAGIVALLTETWAREGAASLGTELAPLFDTASMPPGPPYMVAAGATALCVLALCLAACRPGAEGEAPARPIGVLAAAGRCALSLYLLHVLTGILPFYVLAGDGSTPALTRPRLFLAWAAWCAIAFLVARAWVRAGRSGPAEWLFRRVGG